MCFRVEGCESAGDEDGDGLADCEDPDCVEQCMEDCGNELDDDGDGLIDCQDEECHGDEACQGLYRVEVSVMLDELRLAVGPDTLAETGEEAALWASGSVYLSGEPYDGEGEPFSCSGNLVASPGTGSSMASGPCDGCEVKIAFQPMAFFVGLCPVETLPVGYLGWDPGTDTLTRDFGGLWIEQYVADEADWSSSGQDEEGTLSGVEQQTPWAFSGAY